MAIEEHEEILNALDARDANWLSAILCGSLGSTWAKVSKTAATSGHE